jgi:CRISPR system Cascade subunit CasA
MTDAKEFYFSLLDESIIRYRTLDGHTTIASLPQLLVALGDDAVCDFPALRPHQRHPWHAFLVQLSALAMFRSGAAKPFSSVEDWQAALLNLTLDEPTGCAWCLVSPPARPALLQAPVPEGDIGDWKSVCQSPDELDMLITSKNHDIKKARMRRSEPEDWLFALLSLQTQEGFLGAGNYGVSRMNGGFASRPGVGLTGTGNWGARWRRDTEALLATRARTADSRGFSQSGLALLWMTPWDGTTSLSFASLDPHYIEICRRVRLRLDDGRISAVGTGTKVPRVSAKELNGVTGDPWTPVDIAAGKALTIGAEGFHYKLVAELLFGTRFGAGAAQEVPVAPAAEQFSLVARGIARGQGKTERYHERRVPVSPRVRAYLLGARKTELAQISNRRIAAIGDVRKLLWVALTVLFNNGAMDKDASDSVKDKASRFSRPFEQAEDVRFFDDLTAEVEAADPTSQRIEWLKGLVERAEVILRAAFSAGPRSSRQRYRAQTAALSRFHRALRGDKSPLPELANHYRQQAKPSPGDHSEYA